MFITRAHAQENERNKKLYLRELYINESGIKASDCQYFLAFRLTSNYNLLHQLQKCQNEYLAQDSTVQPMLEQLEKKAHIPLNIIQCDETRLEELKKLIGKVVDKGRFQIEKKKNCVTLLQPPSVYLPTPFGVQKANFFMFFACFKKSIFDKKNFLYPW